MERRIHNSGSTDDRVGNRERNTLLIILHLLFFLHRQRGLIKCVFIYYSLDNMTTKPINAAAEPPKRPQQKRKRTQEEEEEEQQHHHHEEQQHTPQEPPAKKPQQQQEKPPTQTQPAPTVVTPTTETTTTVQKPPTKQWYEIGELNVDGITRYVKADTVPGQKRINGKMTDEEKLKIAFNNHEIRKKALNELKARNIPIIYIGKNTPMGIPANGHYDADNNEHRLAIIKVGVKADSEDSPMAKELKEKIAQPPRATIVVDKEQTTPTDNVEEEAIVNPDIPSVVRIILNFRNKSHVAYLYKDEKQWELWKTYMPPDKAKFKVEFLPPNVEYTINLPDKSSTNEQQEQIWHQLNNNKDLDLIDNEKKSDVFYYFLQEITNEKRNPSSGSGGPSTSSGWLGTRDKTGLL